MEIPKEKIVSLLLDRGDADKAKQAEKELPNAVDPQQHSGLLSKFGIDPQDLISKVAGGLF